jgi:protein gp37
MGNIEEKIRFLSTIEPALTRKAADFYGRRFPGKSTTTVDGVRRVGIRDLVDIETSSGTFIAAGLATHNCYALNFAKRLKAMGQPKYQVDGDPRTSGPGFGVALHPQVLDEPSRWRKARFVFVNSMGDLFHPDVPDQFIWQVFGTMATSPQHRFQILTKRPQRMAALLQTWKLALDGLPGAPTLPLPNVWLGTSIEDDRYTWRADHLRVTPAAIRFLSIEPLLGAVPSLDLTGIDWVIAGGESGHGARAAEEAWVRELRDRCLASGVAFFFKQWGGRTPKAGGRELDGRAWDEMPA